MVDGAARRASSLLCILAGLGWLAAACSERASSDGSGGRDAAGGSSTEGGAGEAPAGCGPTGGGPYWIEEGDSVTAAMACSTGLALPGDAFALANLPGGAVYDPATARLTWKTSLADAAVYVVQVTAAGETGEIKIGVADKLDDPANVPIKDPSTYTEEVGLPVLHLKVTPQLHANLERLQDGVDFKRAYPCGPDATTPPTAENAFCADYDTPVQVTYRGHTYQAQGRYRGWSSLWYAPNKLNYVLKFPAGDRFTEPVLSGGKMTMRNKINLITSIDDNSYIRWRLAFELQKRLHPNGIHVQNYTAVVYVWDEAGHPDYRGLYTVADRVDEDFFHSAGLANNGDVYMAIDHVGNLDVLAPDFGKEPPGAMMRRCYFEGFEKRSGTVDQCSGTLFVPAAFEGLRPLLDFVSRSDDLTFRNDFTRWMDVDDFVTWFIFSTAAETGDSYAKNGIYYHDPEGGGPWRVVVWDFNDSFGQSHQTLRSPRPPRPDASNVWPDPLTIVAAGSTPGVGEAAYNNVLRRLWRDATYGPIVRQRYGAAIRNEISTANMLAMVDDLVKQTQEGARRDERKFGALYRDFWTRDYWDARRVPTGNSIEVIKTYAQELEYLKRWIVDRWTYLQTVFAP